jgi:hypothetical protein
MVDHPLFIRPIRRPPSSLQFLIIGPLVSFPRWRCSHLPDMKIWTIARAIWHKTFHQQVGISLKYLYKLDRSSQTHNITPEAAVHENCIPFPHDSSQHCRYGCRLHSLLCLSLYSYISRFRQNSASSEFSDLWTFFDRNNNGSEGPLRFGDAMVSHFQGFYWWSTPSTDWT